MARCSLPPCRKYGSKPARGVERTFNQLAHDGTLILMEEGTPQMVTATPGGRVNRTAVRDYREPMCADLLNPPKRPNVIKRFFRRIFKAENEAYERFQRREAALPSFLSLSQKSPNAQKASLNDRYESNMELVRMQKSVNMGHSLCYALLRGMGEKGGPENQLEDQLFRCKAFKDTLALGEDKIYSSSKDSLESKNGFESKGPRPKSH